MIYWCVLMTLGAVVAINIALLTGAGDIVVWAAIGLTFGLAVGAAIRSHKHD